MRQLLVACLCLIAALVAAAAVSVRADDRMMASAAEASVAAAIAADAAAEGEHALDDVAALAEVDAVAEAEAEADAERKKKSSKAKAKAKKQKKQKRRYVGGDIMFNRAMSVRGVMAAGSLIANNATVQGTLIARQLKAKRVKAHTISVGELKTTRLSSPTGTIVVEGDLLITHSRTLEFPKKQAKKANATKGAKGGKSAKAAAGKAAKGMAFLAEEVVVGGVKQWALVRHDHFEHGNADGWQLVGSNEPVPTSACSAGGDQFLGGHCQLAHGPARKSYTHLPPHTQVRVTARYHFIDNWRGETAFASVGDSVGDHYVWTQTHHLAAAHGRAAGLQLCGSDAYPETRLSAPIDVSVPHTDSTLTLSFGARSANSAAAVSLADERADACQRSFGVDDVAVYIR